jgi:hypothetical protein
VDQLVGERLEPAQQRGFLSPPAHGWHGQLDQIRRAREILSGQRVADRIGRRTMLLVPRARAPMQRSYQIGLLGPQMRGEHIGKQVVIAIPVALIIQRN